MPNDQAAEEKLDQPTFSWWEKFKDGIRNSWLFTAQDEVSLEEQWDAVVSAFYRLIESGQPVGEVANGYVVQVFESYIIVERSDGTLFRIDYTLDDNSGIEFGDQVEVRQVYEPVGNEDSGETDSETETQTEEPATNEEADEPEEPAANEDLEEDEPDGAEELESETEPEPQVNEEADQETDETAEDEDSEPEPEEPAVNESRCQEYLDLVEFADSHGGPNWALQTLQQKLEEKAEQRQALIEALVANEACAFSAEELDGLDDTVLEKLRLTVEAPVANYAGTPKAAKPEPETGERRTIDLPPLGA